MRDSTRQRCGKCLRLHDLTAERIESLRAKRKQTAEHLDTLYDCAKKARLEKMFDTESAALRTAGQIERAMSIQEREAVDKLRK